MEQRKKGILYVLLSAVIFGSMPLWARHFYAAGGNAESLVFYRSFLALPPLLLLMQREKARWKLDRKTVWSLGVLSLFNALTPLLLFQSYNSISSGMATTIHFIYPVFVLVGSALFCGEAITPVKLACLGLCTAGILCFYTPGQNGALAGMALAFLSGITYAVYTVYLEKSGLKAMPPYQMVFYIALFNSVVLAAYQLPTGRLSFGWSLPIWALLFFFAFAVSVGAVVLFQLGVKYVGPTQTSILSTFEPLTSILLGVAFMNESLTPRSLAGICAILGAVVLLALRGKEPAGKKI